MFEVFRKHTKIFMIVLVILVIPAFVFVGMGNYHSGEAQVVATVGGRDITQQEWEQAQRDTIARIQTSNPNVDIKTLSTPLVKFQILMQLVHQQLLQSAVQAGYLFVSNDALAKALQQIPAIASLRLPDGRIDLEKYRQLLFQNGTTPQIFEAGLRNQLSIEQLIDSVKNTAFAPNSLSSIGMSDFLQQREVQIANFKPADYSSSVKVTAKEEKDYYEKNQAQFQSPANVDVEYVVLDLDSVKRQIAISDSQVKSYFEGNKAAYQPKESRRVSDILITLPTNATPAVVASIKKKAEEVWYKVKKNPRQFAELAVKYSDDASSKAQGGDLGFISQGILPKAMDEQVFALKKDQVSNLIATPEGFHIVMVTEIHGADKKVNFSQVEEGIKAKLLYEEASKRFASDSGKFSKLVYSGNNSYQNVVDQLGLIVQTQKNITQTPEQSTTGLFSNPQLLAAIFASKSIEKKENSDVVQITPTQLVSARVIRYQPASVLSFDAVKTKVNNALVQKKSQVLAENAGKAAFASWQKDASESTLGASQMVSRITSSNIDPKLLETIMSADAIHLPVLMGVDLGVNGYDVVRVNKVNVLPSLDKVQENLQNAQFTRLLSEAELNAYFKSLEKRFKVKIKIPEPLA